MDLCTHSFLKRLRHANHVYWCKRMQKLHADGSFGLTWFWITWDMQIMPHGQDDCMPRFQWDGTSKWLVWNNTFWCMKSNEWWGTQWISLCSYFPDDLSRYKEYLLDESQVWNIEKFKLFQSEDRRDKSIKCLRYDHRDEYLSCEFGTHLRQCGNCFTTHATWNTIVWWYIRTS